MKSAPPPARRPARPARRRAWIRLLVAVLAVGLGVALLLGLLGRWDRAGALTARSGHSLTLLPDDTWLVLGGWAAAGPAADGWLEDAERGGRIPLGGVLQHARAGHTATLLGDGRVLIWGGADASGRLVARGEVFDPATRSSIEWPGPAPAARAGHTATLLPDGRLLLVGGVGPDGMPATHIEAWDLGRGAVDRWAGDLPGARRGHVATLTGVGSVWIEGGEDGAGHPVPAGLHLDPETESVSDGPAPWPGTGPPAVGRTWPPAGADAVPRDAALALAVSSPVDPSSATAETVTLLGPAGPITVDIVPAEGGRLLVVTPRAPLEPGAPHALVLEGLRDVRALWLPRVALAFTTAESDAGEAAIPAALAPLAADPAPAAPAVPRDRPAAPSRAARDPDPDDPWTWRGRLLQGRPWSPWQDLPPRLAPPGVTALSGQVLDLAGRPLGGVTLAVGPDEARTDHTGRFLLALPGAGRDPAALAETQELIIDGATARDPGHAHGRFEVGVALAPRQTTVLPYTIWLPALDTASARALPAGPLPADVVLTSPRMPGLEVRLPAGSLVVDHRGRAVTEVTLTPIPPDRPPFPLPPGVDTPVYFTLQPGGAYISHPAGAGARIVYPNFTDQRRAPPGTPWAFWHYEPETGWAIYGQGAVGADGAQVFPAAGVEVYEFTGAMANVNGYVPPTSGPPPGARAWAGDPVDLATGLFVLSTTDLWLPGPPTLALSRTYRPEDPTLRAFGRGATHAYELVIWSAQPYQEMDLILPDGGRIHYVRTSGGTSNVGAVFAHSGTPTPFDGSVLRWVDPGGGWDLTLRDGTVLHFGIVAPLQWIRDRRGHTVTLDRAGGVATAPVVRVAGSNGRWLALDYDAAGRISEVRDSAGRAVRYTYDADGRLAAVTDPGGGVTRYTYDAAHRMLTITDARGITFLANTYDAAGRVVSQTLADGSARGFSYALDAGGRIAESRVTDPGGSVRRVTFDARGYPTSDTRAWGTALAQTLAIEREPGTARIRALVDPLGRRTAIGHDALGNLTAITALDGTPDAATWRIAYEPRFSRPVTLTDPLGHATALGYDARGDLVELADPTGRRIALTYDADGRPLTLATPAGTTRYAWQPGGLAAVTDPLGRTWTRLDDAAGRPVVLLDPLDRATRLTWDALDRLVEHVDPAGGRTAFAYDAGGNLVAATDAQGHVTTYGHDAMDRRVARADPLGAVTRYQYDADGRLTRLVDRRGQATTLAWDELGRLVTLADADGAVTTFTWDAGDRLVQVDDTRSGTVARQHDLLDRLVMEATPAGAVEYEHDLAGRRTGLTVAGQPPIQYRYDAAGRFTGLTQGAETVALALDAAARPTRVTHPTGLVTDVAWDAASRVTSLTWRVGSTVLGALTQAYDPAGQPVAQGGSWAATVLPAAIGGATYDAADRPLVLGTRALTWDAEGRLVRLDDPATGPILYTWNARGQLVGVDSASARLAFSHDGLGRRVATVRDGLATGWLYDGATPVVEHRQGVGDVTRLVGPGLDMLWARSAPSGRRWPLADLLGSPLAWVSDGGALSTRAAYGPFGEAAASGDVEPVAFTGREQDLPDLLDFRARPYVPSLQRFIAEDPLDEPGRHRYAYVANAPLSGVDPLGLFTIIIHGGLPSLGPNGSSDLGGNRGLNTLAVALLTAGEPFGVYNAGQLHGALADARQACLDGSPVHLIGHSLGGSAVLDIAWRLAAVGIFVSDLTVIDAFHPRFASPPPGIPTFNFFQLQGRPRGGPLGGRKTNSLIDQAVREPLGTNPHLAITLHPRVSATMLRMSLAHQVPCFVGR